MNDNVGWLAGGSSGQYGIILKTTDGGDSWITQYDSDSSDFNSVYFKNENDGLVIGRYGQIWATTNGGNTWILQDDFIYNELFSIAHCETSELWISGSYGTILHSVDGGIPVELTSFSSSINDNDVTLNWKTATETNNQGFQIDRLKTLHKRIDEWQNIGFVNGKGTTTETQSYSFVDENLASGKYLYRLKQIDFDGSYEYSNIIEVEVNAPKKFSLEQNYPNPFNPSTIIGYVISH